MSHDNMAFNGAEMMMDTPPRKKDSVDPRKKMYQDRSQFVDPLYNQGALPYEADTKTFPAVTSESKNGTPLSGVFVLSLGDQKKVPKELEDDYRPYQNRKVDHPTSNSETMLHLLKGSLGTGILAMPMAFYNAGYAIGIGGTLVIGVICLYCVHLLVNTEYELCRRRRVPSLNYQETAIAAMAEGPRYSRAVSPYAGTVVNTFLLIYQLGTCCVYIVFVASNIKSVADVYMEEKMDVRIFMVILLLPLILINWVRNLKLLAPFSTFANMLTLLGFGITLYYLFKDGISFVDRVPVGHLDDMPLFFGTVLFALESIGVVLPLENNMKTPKNFGSRFGVVNMSMSIILSLYVCIGFFGYMKYGPGALGSITLNLPDEEGLAQAVKIMLAVSIFISHALQLYVAIDITWNGYLEPKLVNHKRKVFFEFAVRTCLVLVTFLLAVAIPNLELFISLFGALCLSALGIAIPATLQLMTFWNSHEDNLSFYAMFAKNVALVVFALLGLIVGTYTSIADIIATFS